MSEADLVIPLKRQHTYGTVWKSSSKVYTIQIATRCWGKAH